MTGTITETDRASADSWWGHGWKESPVCQAKERLRLRRKVDRRLVHATRAERRAYRRDRAR